MLKRKFAIPIDAIYTVKMLSDEDAGKLLRHVFNYAENQNIGAQGNILVDLAFTNIKIFMDEYRDSESMGESHRNWKWWISKENKIIRNSVEYKEWRVEVFTRDRYTCKSCWNRWGTLHAHHIKEFSKHKELRLSLNNWITLCKWCHILLHKKHYGNVKK